MPGKRRPPTADLRLACLEEARRIVRDAESVWSALHGTATLLLAQPPPLPAEELIEHTLDRIGAALTAAREEATP